VLCRPICKHVILLTVWTGILLFTVSCSDFYLMFSSPSSAAPVTDSSPAVPDIPSDTNPTVPEEPSSSHTEAVRKVPYVLKITRPDLLIYTGASYDHPSTGKLLDKGSYTIVEEAPDGEGNLWGKLKSGVGWIDLTLAAKEAPEILLTLESTSPAEFSKTGVHSYIHEKTEYTRYLQLNAQQTLSDIRFALLDPVTDPLAEGKILYTLEKLTPEKPLVIGVVFWGDLTTYGITCTDSDGTVHRYYIYESGRDGSAVLQEFSG